MKPSTERKMITYVFFLKRVEKEIQYSQRYLVVMTRKKEKKNKWLVLITQ